MSLIDSDQPKHAACVAHLSAASGPLVTTTACFAEAMHVLHRIAGWPGQSALWGLVEGGSLLIMDLDSASLKRAHALMAKYRDLPMDLGDATLVALAETLHLRTVFALDFHFHVYRLNDRKAFTVVP